MSQAEIIPAAQTPLTGHEALDLVLARYAFDSVLDIGSGGQFHADLFRAAGKRVVCLDASDHYGRAPDIWGDFIQVEFDEQFDLVWCCHVLEHQVDVNAFLRKIFSVMKPGGILAITVPPLRTKLVGGHVNQFTSGSLAYNMILAGFDLSEAALKTYGYNQSIVCRKRLAEPDGLVMDAGDIERLARFFPFPASQGMDGRVESANWSLVPDRRPVAGPVMDAHTLSIEAFREIDCPFEDDNFALEWIARCAVRSGFVAEFGVFKGGSLHRLCAAFPSQVVYGFDSFVGLPEDWVRSGTSTYRTGHFALPGLPEAPKNAELVKGFFDQSLPGWLDTHSGPAAFLHIDADLYSSARDVLWLLNSRIEPGCVILFDELCDWGDSGIYPLWPEGEWKALLEWMETFDRKIQVLARGPQFSAAVVVVQ